MKQYDKAGASPLEWKWRALVIFVLFIFNASITLAAVPTPAAVISAGAEQELLEPERAFLLSARFKDAKSVEFLYKIADGYYMYRARFKVVADPKTSAVLGKAVFTKGEMKQDASFGRVEIYRNSMRILLPVSAIGKDISVGEWKFLRLKVTSQGCANVGVCYPPLHQVLTLKIGNGDVNYPDSPSRLGGDVHATQSASEAVKPSISEILRKAK